MQPSVGTGAGPGEISSLPGAPAPVPQRTSGSTSFTLRLLKPTLVQLGFAQALRLSTPVQLAFALAVLEIPFGQLRRALVFRRVRHIQSEPARRESGPERCESVVAGGRVGPERLAGELRHCSRQMAQPQGGPKRAFREQKEGRNRCKRACIRCKERLLVAGSGSWLRNNDRSALRDRSSAVCALGRRPGTAPPLPVAAESQASGTGDDGVPFGVAIGRIRWYNDRVEPSFGRAQVARRPGSRSDEERTT